MGAAYFETKALQELVCSGYCVIPVAASLLASAGLESFLYLKKHVILLPWEE